jgi:hypothetical protein
MPEIIRRRTIRPSSRKKTSPNYRVHIKSITAGDTLLVAIRHESKSYHKIFTFRGQDILQHKSLGFRVNDKDGQMEIIWASTQPIRITIG